MKKQTGKFITSESAEYILDPETNKPALSKIDSKNLTEIASELGVKYDHREANKKIVLPDMNKADLKSGGSVTGEAITDLTWILSLVLFLGLLTETIFIFVPILKRRTLNA